MNKALAVATDRITYELRCLILSVSEMGSADGFGKQ